MPSEAHHPAGVAPDGVVCFAAVDWWYHSRAHSEVQLMLRLAPRTPVLFVNSIGMRVPTPGKSTEPVRRIGRKLRSFARGLRRPVAGLPDFHVLSPVTVPLGSERARALNAASVRAQVRLAMRHLGIRRPVIVVTVPNAWDVVRPMDRTALVFNRSDLHSAFEEADTALIASLERELLTHADHVLYVSHALMADEQPLTGTRATFLDHGVDLDRFHPGAAPEPPALASIARPRVGFFGGLEPQTVDFTLLDRLAADLPEAQIVLVGNATVAMDDLVARPNVHWLGMQPYEDVPRYGAGFDVAIMPWLRNAWIEACNPIKLKEYLALGLPTVSTEFAELERYRDVVRAVTDPADFSSAVRESLATGGPGSVASRRASVEHDSWDGKADLLARLVGL